jgi:purine-binding chemotaxis protein CheW
MATATAEPRLFSKSAKPLDPGSAASSIDPRSGKYLTFRLAREEFAIQVLRVREIMGMQEITAVPQTPHYMKGVINLRGKIVPVIDLRLKFGFEEVESTPATCIIVVQLQSGKETLLMGLRVDAVSEVLNFASNDIENTPDFGQGVATPYLLGMAKMKDSVKILLNIDEVLSTTEVQNLEAVL